MIAETATRGILLQVDLESAGYHCGRVFVYLKIKEVYCRE